MAGLYKHFSAACLALASATLVWLSAGALATTTHYPCHTPFEISHQCNMCKPSCPTCYTYGKCGEPSDSGECRGPEWDGISHACDETPDQFCPGRGKIWNNLTACETEDPIQLLYDEAYCMILEHEYSKAVNAQTQNNCLP